MQLRAPNTSGHWQHAKRALRNSHPTHESWILALCTTDVSPLLSTSAQPALTKGGIQLALLLDVGRLLLQAHQLLSLGQPAREHILDGECAGIDGMAGAGRPLQPPQPASAQRRGGRAGGRAGMLLQLPTSRQVAMSTAGPKPPAVRHGPPTCLQPAAAQRAVHESLPAHLSFSARLRSRSAAFSAFKRAFWSAGGEGAGGRCGFVSYVP